MKPFVKWAGGKKQLLHDINLYIPENINVYFEPFVGGGAVLFDLLPEQARINDINEELINTYKQIKMRPRKLIELLKEHQKKHNNDYYYMIRDLDRSETYRMISDLDRAARFIYLNKTCFNGLYRVNKKGQFNAPIGKYNNPLICDEENIIEISHYFKKNKISIENKDFEIFLKESQKGDFVYMDPPYDPLTKTSNFTNYNEQGFSKEEQIRLKKICDELNYKGVKFLLSNSDTDFINVLYSDYKIIKVKAKRTINANKNKRGEINELLIMNY